MAVPDKSNRLDFKPVPHTFHHGTKSDRFKVTDRVIDSTYADREPGAHDITVCIWTEAKGCRHGDTSFRKEFYMNQAPEGFKQINNVDGVYISDDEIVITGSPEEDDENHNCDEMGCSSVSHVLYRATILDFYPVNGF
jgi:hypothetical protein